MPQEITDRIEDSSASQKLVSEYSRLQTHVESLEEQIEQLTESKSWKLTKPLRVGKLLLNYLRSSFSIGRTRLVPKTLAGLVVTGPKPTMMLGSTRGWLPTGWVSLVINAQAGPLPDFILYVDDGSGFSEDLAIRLNFSVSNALLIKLPKLVRQLRLDSLINKSFEFREIWAKPRWTLPVLWAAARSAKLNGQSPIDFLRSTFKAFFRGGAPLVTRHLLGWNISRVDYNKCYERWIKRYDSISERDREQMRSAITSWKHSPLISILMPVYNTNPRWLRLAIESVEKQIYSNWELCIVDDASNRPEVDSVLASYESNPRIRVIRRRENGHISVASNDALAMARGDFVALMDHDDELSEHALYYIVSALNQAPDADLIYSDEDRITAQGKRRDPYFKCDWNPELMLSQNLVSHLGVYRTSLARSVGGFRLGFEGSQDWDFALRFSDRVSSDKILHVPKVLYHWRLVPGTVSYNPDTKVDALDSAERAVSDHLNRLHIAGSVRADAPFGVRTSFILPSNLASQSVLVGCSCNVEIAEELSHELSTLLKEVKVINAKSLSEFLGQAVVKNPESLGWLLYVGPEVARIEPGAVQALLAVAGQEKVGAVGALSVNQHGVICQAGLVCTRGPGSFGAFEGMAAHANGYFGLENRFRRVSAIGSELVMINCAALKSVKHLDHGSDRITVIDLCSALTEAGLRVLFEPKARCVLSSNVQQNFQQNNEKQAKKQDPYYSPNLCRDRGGYFFDFDRELNRSF